MPQIVSFEVLGQPQHQGSMRAFTPKGWKRPILTSDNSKLKPWRQDVAACALEVTGGVVFTGPVRVEAQFYFTRPKSTPKRDRFRTMKITKPDIDKLLRALLDALTGTVFVDDSQVSVVWMSKKLGLSAKTVVKITTIEEVSPVQ